MSKKQTIAGKGTSPQTYNFALRGIEKPETVLAVCLPALRKQFGQTALGFKPAVRSSRVTRYSLSGPGCKKGTAREAYSILPLCRSIEAIYWAGITVNFQFSDSTHQLVDAGIVIFKGGAFEDNKALSCELNGTAPMTKCKQFTRNRIGTSTILRNNI